MSSQGHAVLAKNRKTVAARGEAAGGPRRAPEARAGSRLLGEARRSRMLDWLREEGSARVSVLASAFGVSEVTVRQDLEKLEADGHVTREHGGAFLKSVPDQVRAMALQHQEHRDAKQRIGRVAAGLVGDGETIIIDSGSTTTEVAANLFGRRDMTIITNALNIALMLGAEPGFDVHMTGGHFKAPTLSLSGDESVRYFSDIFASKLFLATAGVALDTGLTYPSFADLQLKKAMIKAAAHVYLVADSSKINRASFTRLDNLDVIDSFITDDGISDKDAKAFEKVGIEVLIAPPVSGRRKA